MEQKMYDLFIQAGWDVEGTLKRLLNDDALYRELLIKYTTDKNFAKLGSCLSEENYKDAFMAAHTLKGIVVNLGITPMKTPIESVVELLRREQSGEAWREVLQEKMKVLEAVHKDVVALIEKLG